MRFTCQKRRAGARPLTSLRVPAGASADHAGASERVFRSARLLDNGCRRTKPHQHRLLDCYSTIARTFWCAQTRAAPLNAIFGRSQLDPNDLFLREYRRSPTG